MNHRLRLWITRIAQVVGVAVALFISANVPGAEQQCYEWYITANVNGTPQTFAGTSPTGVVTAYLQGTGQATAPPCGPSASVCYGGWTVQSCTPNRAPNGIETFQCQTQRSKGPGPQCNEFQVPPGANCYNTTPQTSAAGGNSRSSVCEDLCAQDAGTKQFFGFDGGTVPGETCRDGCKYQQTGVSVKVGGYAAGGFSTDGTSCTDPPDAESGVNCVTSSLGRFCASKQETNCGTVNGEKVCADDVPQGGCAITGSGGALCAQDSPNAPTDSEGDPVDPDAEFSAPSGGGGGGNTTYNYYGAGKVGSSSTPVVGTETGDSETGGDDGGDGEEGPGLDDLEGGELGAVDGFGPSTSAFMARVESAPIIAGIAGLGNAVPEGSCPDWSTSIDLYGSSIDVDFGIVCQLWDDIASIISAVMLAAWAWLAIRTLLSA